jgi:hypothetical protein
MLVPGRYSLSTTLLKEKESLGRFGYPLETRTVPTEDFYNTFLPGIGFSAAAGHSFSEFGIGGWATRGHPSPRVITILDPKSKGESISGDLHRCLTW